MRDGSFRAVTTVSTRLVGLLACVLLPACGTDGTLFGTGGSHSSGTTASGGGATSGTGGHGGATGTGGHGGACSNACAAGATKCSGALVEQCQTQADGCTVWSSPSACPAGTCLVDACTAIPVDGTLVAYWSFAEPGPTVVDRSGNANHGISWGAAQVPGKIGLGYQTGANQCLLFPLTDSLMMDGGKAVTMMAWVSSPACPQSDNAIIFNKDFAYELGVECPSKKLQTAVMTDKQPWLWDQASLLPLGGWHHLAATWDGATMALYLDGAPVGSWPATGQFVTTTAGVGIGCYHVPGNGMPDPGIGGFFPGIIDEVAIYRRSLTPSEITSYYNATK